MLIAENVLASLKDFQRKTVEYVFHRMYLDENPTFRFLIADEVGLGKTLVARGLIAKAIEKMQKEGNIDRIDIVYVCSNAAIARQNINRLNVTWNNLDSGEEGSTMTLATRLTLLPLHFKDLEKKRLNFVSFTPGTTFDLKSSTGVVEERALIYRMLCGEPEFQGLGFRKMLQCDAGDESWDARCSNRRARFEKSIAEAFRRRVVVERELCETIHDLSIEFAFSFGRPQKTLRKRRNRAISRLRSLLAQVCVGKLEPDLIILDEFQRFRELLHGDDEAAQLARQLMEYEDLKAGSKVRVLLLSATPYKMFTLDHEDENHYEDFMATLRFLFHDNEDLVEDVQKDLEAFRLALYSPSENRLATLAGLQKSLQRKMMQVMVRTERVASTKDRDAMLAETIVRCSLQPDDLQQAVGLDSLMGEMRGSPVIEYWKSAPYLLNFMKGYQVKKRFEELLEAGDPLVLHTLTKNRKHLISHERVMDYQSLAPGNPRLRALLQQTVEDGSWKLLWIPASMPYYQPEGVFQESCRMTKTLVFSTWNVVPDAISAILSYEAERRMVRASEPLVQYGELHRKFHGFLRFAMKEDQPAGMSTLALLYPSPVLAEAVDPLEITQRWKNGGVPDAETVLQTAQEILSSSIRDTQDFADPSVFPDRSWYWASLAKLDALCGKQTASWCTSMHEGLSGSAGGLDTGEQAESSTQEVEGTAFPKHVEAFVKVFDENYRLGEAPHDLGRVLAQLSLGSPAVCASRALHRIAPSLSYDNPALMSAAFKVANGFRSLFNNPDSQLLLRSIRGEEVPLWRVALEYAIDGNLQAVLDEYAHILKEFLGLFNHPDDVIVREVAQAMHEALSLYVSNLSVDQIQEENGRFRIAADTFRIRCRYAMRFSDIKDDKEKVLVRAGSVRQAFNSPFKPFVLASTSIGQEGLDFHSYCHSVWHWNLPSNPVDLEQREGRINRYKGHAIRRNIASRYSLDTLRKLCIGLRVDPWEILFDLAASERSEELNDLCPYWVFEDAPSPCKVERNIPLLPFSREESRLVRLKSSLARYRLAFGQPRQEDLLACLEDEEKAEDLLKYSVRLEPGV